MHVRDVEYIENGSEHLTGTLYMTTFRVVFAPDRETNDTNLVDENSHHRTHISFDIVSRFYRVINISVIMTFHWLRFIKYMSHVCIQLIIKITLVLDFFFFSFHTSG